MNTVPFHMILNPARARRLLMSLFIIVSSTIAIALHAETPENYFKEGNRFFDEANYSNAIVTYQSALTEGESASLHFNLANAYFMNSEAGFAIFHYKKSLLLDPTNPDTEANLKFVLDALQLSPPPKNFLQQVSTLLSLNRWCWILALSFWVTLCFILIPLLSSWKGAAPLSCIVVSVIIVALSLCGLIGYHLDRNTGIIVANEAALKRAPTTNSPVDRYLTAGETLSAIDSYSDYIKVKSNEGKIGWVSNMNFRKLWE